MKNGGYLGRVPGNSAVVLARQNYAPSGVTTDFTFSSGYSVGYIDAYINGVRQLEGEDYYATDGTTLTFNDAITEIEEYFDEYFTETMSEVLGRNIDEK